MGKGRLEAFSDGVLAIALTIMVLELKVPHGDSWAALDPVWPTLLAYLLSYVYVGIYWNNHHHMLHATRQVDGRVLWANLHLLFWLTLVAASTSWLGEYPQASAPVATYGVVLFGAAVAYWLLERAIFAANRADPLLERAVGRDTKGLISAGLYALGIVAAFWHPWIAEACYVVVALLWVVPDPRIERRVAKGDP